MRLIKTAVVMALTAALVMALAAGASSARTRVEVSTTAALASGRLTFTPANNIRIICDVTLHITLLRLIEKRLLEHAGAITAILTANPRSDLGGTTRCAPLSGMTVHYGAIGGSLPRIDSVTLFVRSKFLIFLQDPFRTILAECLYEGLVGATGPNPISELTPSEGNQVPRIIRLRNDRNCPEEGELSGTFTVTPTVTVRLLE
jgi:hypothetical protein